MSIDACAGLVERGDPDRFAAVMAAPKALRGRLLVLYAFNLEVARVPWVTGEPMIAEMRLQWWRDVVASDMAVAHEVAGPMLGLIREAGLPVAVLDRLVAARLWEVNRQPFADRAAFDGYLEHTGAGLMWLAARALGAGAVAEPAVRDFGWASGLAGYLRAVPQLVARGLVPLIDGREAAVAGLAGEGLARTSRARAGRHLLGPARAALLAGWQTQGLLRQVARDPGVVARGGMGLSEFARRGGLLWQGWTGRF